MASKISAVLSPRKGTWPVAISYSTTPNENKSVRASRSLARACSGDIYATVPTADPGLVRSGSSVRVAVASTSGLARNHLRQPEVQNLRVPALGHENVGGLDVPVNDALGVRRVKRIRRLHAQRQQGIQLHGPVLDHMLESFAVQEFHGDERKAVLLANVVDRADVGVVECGRGLGFALETAERLRVAGHFIGKELQGHEATQPCVLGFVDHTHAAAAQPLKDAVVRYGLADHQGQILRGRNRQVNEGSGVEPQRIAGVTSRFIRISVLQMFTHLSPTPFVGAESLERCENEGSLAASVRCYVMP